MTNLINLRTAITSICLASTLLSEPALASAACNKNPISQCILNQILEQFEAELRQDFTYTAGNGVSISSNNVISTVGNAYVCLGDLYQGGVVAYIKDPNTSTPSTNQCGSSGLLISTAYLNAGTVLPLVSSDQIQNIGQGYGSGQTNTTIMTSRNNNSSGYMVYFAPRHATDATGAVVTTDPDLTVTIPGSLTETYGGWFIPSYMEAALALQNYAYYSDSVTFPSGSCYWTSTTNALEASGGRAYSFSNNGSNVFSFVESNPDADTCIGPAFKYF